MLTAHGDEYCHQRTLWCANGSIWPFGKYKEGVESLSEAISNGHHNTIQTKYRTNVANTNQTKIKHHHALQLRLPRLCFGRAKPRCAYRGEAVAPCHVSGTVQNCIPIPVILTSQSSHDGIATYYDQDGGTGSCGHAYPVRTAF